MIFIALLNFFVIRMLLLQLFILQNFYFLLSPLHSDFLLDTINNPTNKSKFSILVDPFYFILLLVMPLLPLLIYVCVYFACNAPTQLRHRLPADKPFLLRTLGDALNCCKLCNVFAVFSLTSPCCLLCSLTVLLSYRIRGLCVASFQVADLCKFALCRLIPVVV